MATNNKISWIPFCKELAKKLMEFRNDRKPLVEAVKRALKCAYGNYNKDKTKKRKIPTLQYKKDLDEIVDIDPFTIIGLFGRETGEDIRAETVKAFVADDVFPELKSLVPKNIEENMDFGDMPKLGGTAASLCMSAATHEDIESLWELFEAAVKYANNPKDNRDLVKCFDSVESKVSQVRGKKISTALSWIAPELFMNLSGDNLPDYIEKAELKGVPENVKQLLDNSSFSGEEYFEILNGLKSCLGTNGLKDFLELNLRAYDANKSGGSQGKKKKTQKEKDKSKNEAQQKKEEPKNENETPTEDQYLYLSGNFLEDVFMDGEQYNTLLRLLRNKKNIILQGPPGVGKTYAAKRLAWSILGKCNEDNPQIQFVQFHQNYSYEDFVIGYKPTGEGFKLRKGIFYKFCEEAQEKEEAYKKNPEDKGNWYFLIIDEINRGNTSKIFGELLMLIENGYRGKKHALKLAYEEENEQDNPKKEDKRFYVPENLFIIGMMNTADRSLAMLDYALRRRFTFVNMEPAFDAWKSKDRNKRFLKNTNFKGLIDWVTDLNKKVIAEDPSLGSGFCIGHSYFCDWDECTDDKMLDVLVCDIIPTLEEYWFDSKDKVKKLVNGEGEGKKNLAKLPEDLREKLGEKYKMPPKPQPQPPSQTSPTTGVAGAEPE